MPTLGRKPSGDDIGFGELWGGNSRGTIVGRPSVNGWAVLIGGRLGYGGSSGVNMQLGLYSTSGGSITSRLATSPTFYVNTYMRHASQGANYERELSGGPIRVFKNTDYALAAATHGTNLGSFGQDHSGWPMHDDTGILPATYTAHTVSAQGRMSLWLEVVGNRKPNKPSSLTPSPGSIITDNTPTIGASFSDPDETFADIPAVKGKYALGQADKMRAYRFEVLNANKSARLWDTGKTNANSTQQSQRRVNVTTSTLSAGTYVARATFWDQFDTPSTAAEWTFTINAGGAMVDVDLRHNELADVDRRVTTLTDAIIPEGTWTHSGGLSTNAVQARVRTAAGAIHWTSEERGQALTPGTRWGAWTSLYDEPMPPLSPGGKYYVEFRGRDSTGLWSPWARGPVFTVNAPPNTPTGLSPAGTIHDTPPMLSATITDANDESAELEPLFAVRAAGDTGGGTSLPLSECHFAAGKWNADPSSVMTSHGVYEWRVLGQDRYGAAGNYSAWQTITYATPPEVTITEPDNNAVLETGTPTLSGSSSKSMTAYSVTIRDVDTGIVAHGTGDMTASGSTWTYDVPAALLRNETTYDATVEVVSTEGLRGAATVRFTVSYPQPEALASADAEPTPGPHEPVADPSQWSRIALTFDAASEAVVTDDDFAGYVIRRVDLGTGDELTLAILEARDDTVFIDRTPRSGVAYRYDVSYLAWRNGIDIVESAAVSAHASVILRCTVLTSMDADDFHVPLRRWEKRSVDWVGDEEYEVAIGVDKPIAFRGATDYDRLRGTWTALDDPHGTYTARDLVAELRNMKRPLVLEDGELAPRIVLYRDPRRSGFYIFRNGGEDDHHSDRVAPIDLELIEVHASEGIEI